MSMYTLHYWPIPFRGQLIRWVMAPDLWLAQMPAVLMYLGEAHGLMPEGTARRAQVIKVICDANDVLDSLTLGGGAQMWTAESWADRGLPRCGTPWATDCRRCAR